MLEHADYEALVQRLEGYAQAHPGRYAVQVGALAGLGYAYAWLVLVIATTLLVWLIRLEIRGTISGAGMIRITLALLLFIYTILRALWVRFERPGGIVIARHDAPALMGLVDELVTAVDARRFDAVVVSADFNAAVSQLPRFGLLGGYRNFLVVGLPLAHALTVEEFRAVLAHEVGHLSRAHGRFAAWIYRVRAMWVNLGERLQQRRTWGAWIFEWFLKWWAPYFNAYSFVLARAQEYEADRFAAGMGGVRGAEALGRALMKLEVVGAWVERGFWTGVRRQLAQQAEPPEGTIGGFAAAVGEAIPTEFSARWLRQALARRTNVWDTHPSVSERLRAMGVDPAFAALDTFLPPSGGLSAAAHYLGDVGAQLTTQLDTLWRSSVREGWAAGHEAVLRKTERLAQLDGRAAAGPLDAALQWERSELTRELRGEEAAEPLLRELLRTAPDHPFANLSLGQLLLDRDEEAGLELVKRAIAAHPACREPGHALLIDYYERHGRRDEAEQHHGAEPSQGDELAAAEAERAGVNNSDTFLSHGLEVAETERITRQLEAIAEIREAYLARKDLTHFADMPLYVLGVRLDREWYRQHSSAWVQGLLQRIVKEVEFPGEWLVVALDTRTEGIAARLSAIPGSCVVRR